MLKKILQAVLQGKYQIELTLKRDAVGDIPDMLNMALSRFIKLSIQDFIVLLTVAETRKWEDDADRSITISFSSEFDKEFFINRMRHAFENIENVYSY